MITMLGNAPIAFGAIWVASRYVWDAWREYHFAWNSSVADRINDAKLVIAEERGKKILAMAEGTPNSPRLLLLGAFELIAFLAIGYYLDRWLSRENPYELHVIAYACAGICAWFVGVSGLHFQGAAQTGKRVFHGGVLAAGGCKSLSVNWSWGISSSSPFRGRRSEGERSEPNADDPGRGCDTRFASLVAGHAGLFVVATKHSNTQVPHDPPKRL